MKFVGMDLGWVSGPSGLCCLALTGDELILEQLDRKDSLEEVLAWLDKTIEPEEPAIVAVDAPTIIPNETGMRLPDKLTHKYFGKYHAGCYPANLGRPFASRLVAFGKAIEGRGFNHAPTMAPRQTGRYQIEVFPHPAMIQLFGLSRILKYKKGRLAEKRKGLGELRDRILKHLSSHTPSLKLESLPEVPTGGKALKELEDKLDSIVCAYVGAYWWYWGESRGAVLGDRASGYIVVPCPPDAPEPPMSRFLLKGDTMQVKLQEQLSSADAQAILERLPKRIQTALIDRASEIDYPIESVVEMAIASFLDSEALGFADCKPGRGR